MRDETSGVLSDEDPLLADGTDEAITRAGEVEDALLTWDGPTSQPPAPRVVEEALRRALAVLDASEVTNPAAEEARAAIESALQHEWFRGGAKPPPTTVVEYGVRRPTDGSVMTYDVPVTSAAVMRKIYGHLRFPLVQRTVRTWPWEPAREEASDG